MIRIGQFLLLTSSALLLSVGSAKVQHLRSSSADPDYTISKDPPGVSGVTVDAGTPAGFDPTNASDEELQAYGYPRQPEPDDTKADGASRRAVRSTRISELVPKPLHRPNQRLATQHREGRIRQLERLFSGRRPGVRSSRWSLGSPGHRFPTRVVHRLQRHIGGHRW